MPLRWARRFRSRRESIKRTCRLKSEWNRLRRIREGLTESLDRAVAELRIAKGLIIDVRGNSGGGFDRGAHANLMSDRSIDPERPRFTGPMAVFIDARCISAGEGWASWFMANNRARFFEETTAGSSSGICWMFLLLLLILLLRAVLNEYLARKRREGEGKGKMRAY